MLKSKNTLKNYKLGCVKLWLAKLTKMGYGHTLLHQYNNNADLNTMNARQLEILLNFIKAAYDLGYQECAKDSVPQIPYPEIEKRN